MCSSWNQRLCMHVLRKEVLSTGKCADSHKKCPPRNRLCMWLLRKEVFLSMWFEKTHPGSAWKNKIRMWHLRKIIYSKSGSQSAQKEMPLDPLYIYNSVLSTLKNNTTHAVSRAWNSANISQHIFEFNTNFFFESEALVIEYWRYWSRWPENSNWLVEYNHQSDSFVPFSVKLINYFPWKWCRKQRHYSWTKLISDHCLCWRNM